MRTALVGSTGHVAEVLRLGPATLTRHREWDDATPMAALFREAGYDAYVNHPLDNTMSDPDLWVITDVPRAVLVQSGLYPRIRDGLETGRARILALGGCFGFGGAQGSGGWGDDPLLPLICEVRDDTCERHGGIVAESTGSHPAPSWTSFGFNRVTALDGCEVLATFEGHPAWVQDKDRRRIAWTTGLFPHWGPKEHERGQIRDWLAGLYDERTRQ